MIEPFVPIFIAAATGFAVLTNRIYGRIAMLDQKVDGIELKVVQNYVNKSDFQGALSRMEAHLIRMEDKIDAIASNKCK
tara:strand:- start:924 stop:1160 length:237 start_codon:yes stop_codon:yes gene_type:complete